MLVYKVKRIPEGFSYIPSKRAILDAIKKYGMSNISLVSFNGVSMTELSPKSQKEPSFSSHHLGIIRAIRKYEGWQLELEIVAISDKNIGDDSVAIETIFLNDVRLFQKEIENLRFTHPGNLKEMFLQFKRNNIDGKVESTSFKREM